MGGKIENEQHIKEQVEEALSLHFELLKEVPGKNKMLDQGVRIDYMCRAKPAVVEQGFCEEWFGVECKYIRPEESGGKLSRLVWQSMTYVQSEFEVEGGIVSPRFVLTCSNFEPPDDRCEAWKGVSAYGVARYGCVGMLLLSRGYRLWTVRFGIENYAYKYAGNPVHVQPKHLPTMKVGSL